MDASVASIKWDRDARVQEIDLSVHRTWDHGYAETVYSAQSKTYDRVFVLAPVRSPLVTGQNYYTAITRARFGAKLWTEDRERLVERLLRRSGEKSSAIEGLGRIGRDGVAARGGRHRERLETLRERQIAERRERDASRQQARTRPVASREHLFPERVAGRAHWAVQLIDRWLNSLIDHNRGVDQVPSRPGSGELPRAGREPDRTPSKPHGAGDSRER